VLEAAICLAVEDPAVADRVAAALSRFGYRTVDCLQAACPSGASAVVTDRPFGSCCRRAWSGAPEEHDLPAGSCEVPLIRVGLIRLPDETGDAFATLPPAFTDEMLLITVTRAVRYGQHLATMQAIRGSGRF